MILISSQGDNYSYSLTLAYTPFFCIPYSSWKWTQLRAQQLILFMTNQSNQQVMPMEKENTSFSRSYRIDSNYWVRTPWVT